MRKTLLAALLIVLAWGLFLGASDPGVGMSPTMYRGAGLSSEISGLMGGTSAVVDTVKITTRHATYPNSAASDSGWVYADGYYDFINESTDGSKIMWGYVDGDNGGTLYDQSYYIFTRGAVSEDDADSTNIDELAFIWFDLTGLEGMQNIEEAYITINVAAFSTVALDAGEYVSVRLDTVATDYAITSETIIASAGADSNRFNASWNELAATAGTIWTPSLGSRDDRHDYGPRSDTRVEGPASLTAGTPLRFNVTDALQQHLDNGMADQGALFIIYGDKGTGNGVGNCLFSAGYHATYVGSTGRGNPQLTVTATSRAKPKPWSGRRVPVALVFDDNRDAHSQAVIALNAAGETFNFASFVTGELSNSSYEATVDSATSSYLIHHTYNHSILGELTGDDLAFQVDPTGHYGWWDGNAIVDFAWAGGDSQVTSFEAIQKIRNHGFRSARATRFKYNAVSPIGAINYLAWDWPVNVYAIAAPNMSVILEDGGGPGDFAYIKEQLGDYADEYYTDHGKAALILYGHGNTGQEDGINIATIASVIAADALMNSIDLIGYGDLITMRMAGAAFLDPGSITAANGAPAVLDTAAAKYDSIGASWCDSVWIDVKGGDLDFSLAVGDFVHGESYVISGSGFGTNSATQIWDDLEDGAANTSATQGTWTTSASLSIATSDNRHGNSSYHAAANLGDSTEGAFTGGSDSAAWFCSYWFKVDPDFDFALGKTNIKIFRLWSTSGTATNNLRMQIRDDYIFDLAVEAADSSRNWSPVVTGFDWVDNVMGHGNPASQYPPDPTDMGWQAFTTDIDDAAWHHFQWEYQESTETDADGSYDGILKMWFDGKLIFDHSDMITRRDQTNQLSSYRPKYIGWYESGSGNDASQHVYFDDAYITNSRARVELGNNATYADCTVRELQYWSAWSDTEITITANAGQLAGTAYLFVTDSSGSTSSAGTVTIR